MVQFNLLPDVKLEFIKAQRTKRMAMGISSIVAAVALTVFVSLFMVVKVFQRQHLNNLNRDIKSSSSKLQAIEDLDKILTVQNQLNSLPGLHNKKPVVSRLFGYLSQITPAQLGISKLTVDFETNVMSISGETDSLNSVNRFVDTIKFTDYGPPNDTQTKGKAFSNVVMASYTRNDKGAEYKIELNFDPAIFDSTSEVALTVPKITTTRSEVEKPSALFQKQEKPEEQRR